MKKLHKRLLFTTSNEYIWVKKILIFMHGLKSAISDFQKKCQNVWNVSKVTPGLLAIQIQIQAVWGKIVPKLNNYSIHMWTIILLNFTFWDFASFNRWQRLPFFDFWDWFSFFIRAVMEGSLFVEFCWSIEFICRSVFRWGFLICSIEGYF